MSIEARDYLADDFDEQAEDTLPQHAHASDDVVARQGHEITSDRFLPRWSF